VCPADTQTLRPRYVQATSVAAGRRRANDVA